MFDNAFMRELWTKLKPRSYEDILKMIGFAHSTNVWKDNGEWSYDEHRMSLREIPAYREDVFNLISERLQKKGIYDSGLAYEVAEKTWRGYYAKEGHIDEETMMAMFRLDIDEAFVFFIEQVNYMFPKAHGVACLREAIRMMFYKNNFNQKYNKIILEK